MSETNPHDENDDIAAFDLEFLNVKLELNKTNDDIDKSMKSKKYKQQWTTRNIHCLHSNRYV